MAITPAGFFKVSFSKPILPVDFALPQIDSPAKRNLQIVLEDAVTLEIDDADTELDKSIAKAEIGEIGSTYFTV